MLASVLSGLLVGCASDTETYCDALEGHQDELADLAAGARDPQADLFGESLAIFSDLRDKAPSDIADEWDTFVFAWEGVAEAFDAADVDPKGYKPNNPPEGVDPGEDRAIEDAAQELGSARVVDAGNGIEQHASDVCKVDLGL